MLLSLSAFVRFLLKKLLACLLISDKTRPSSRLNDVGDQASTATYYFRALKVTSFGSSRLVLNWIRPFLTELSCDKHQIHDIEMLCYLFHH